MGRDNYNLKGRSDSELHAWLAGYESTSVEYLAGIQELMEGNDAPVNGREWIAMSLAIISIVVTVIVVVLMYQ